MQSVMQALTQSVTQSIAQEYMQQGMQQGMQVKSLDIAKNMLFKLHLDFDSVQKATGLSKEILETLKEE